MDLLANRSHLAVLSRQDKALRCCRFNDDDDGVTDLAKAEGLAANYIDRVLRLAFLSPTVVTAILNGTTQTNINLERLKDVKLIAPSWTKQHRLLGVAAAQR